MSENKIETLRWVEDHLEMIDQRILPADFQYISYNSALTVAVLNCCIILHFLSGVDNARLINKY